MKNAFVRLMVCLLLAAMMTSCAAMAELDLDFDVPDFEDIFTPADEYQIEVPDIPVEHWIHESELVGFLIPADWTETEFEDNPLFPYFFEPDGIGNMTITVTESDGTDIFLSFDTYKASFYDIYTENGATVESFELTTYGGRDAFECVFTYSGIQQTQVLIQSYDKSEILNFGFAASAQAHVDLVMDSVWLAY